MRQNGNSPTDSRQDTIDGDSSHIDIVRDRRAEILNILRVSAIFRNRAEEGAYGEQDVFSNRYDAFVPDHIDWLRSAGQEEYWTRLPHSATGPGGILDGAGEGKPVLPISRMGNSLQMGIDITVRPLLRMSTFPFISPIF